MAAAHTPGPWTKSNRLEGPFWHIYSDHTVGGEKCKQGKQAVAAVYGEGKRGAKAYAEMFEANARLIATAPALLGALLKLHRVCVAMDLKNQMERPTEEEYQAAIAGAAAAITSATEAP